MNNPSNFSVSPPVSDPANRFTVNTFRPSPVSAKVSSMIRAQASLELKLLVRNGEQLLLTLFIPVTLLVGLALLPIGDLGDNRLAHLVPAILAIAVMSTAFTGQAIAVGFDRRYGALKRLGATALPRWGVIVGKSIAVLIVVFFQSIILGGIGFTLGWSPSITGLVLGALGVAVGTVTFSALGLLIGGTLKAEIILALANILWFIFLGLSSLVVMENHVPRLINWIARCTPSGALTEVLTHATNNSVDFAGFCVLLCWAAIAGAAAIKYFRFI